MTKSELEKRLIELENKTRWSAIYQNRNVAFLCHYLILLADELKNTCSDSYKAYELSIKNIADQIKANEEYTIKPFIEGE